MGEKEKTEIVQIFTDKITEIQGIFELERQRQKKAFRDILKYFAIFIITIVFYSGMMTMKVNNMVKSQYVVGNKVERLYMIAYKDEKITLDMMTEDNNIVPRGAKIK